MTPGEIAGEIYAAMADQGQRVSHIVLMGIGEPLDNFDNVMDFLSIISSPHGVNIGMRNISLSTCGLVPKIGLLAKRRLQLTLSISLHAPTNETPIRWSGSSRRAAPIRRRQGGASALNTPWCGA